MRGSLVCLAACGLLGLLGAGVLVAQDTAGGSPRRVIILGFDGVDPERVREYMKDGDLPNLSELASRGTFSSLATTNPAESPVSWAAFSVGANPGKTGIYDFLKRIPNTYIPDIALVKRDRLKVPGWTRVAAPAVFGLVFAVLPLLIAWMFNSLIKGKAGPGLPRYAFWGPSLVLGTLSATTVACIMSWWVPEELPKAVLARQGTPFWHTAGEHGVGCCMIQVPVTFPAVASPNGRLLTGLGTPDVRQSWGTPTIYATRFPEKTLDPVNAVSPNVELTGFGDSVTGSKLVHLEFPEGDQVEVRTLVFGPTNFTLTDEFKRQHPEVSPEESPPLTIRLDKTSNTATFTVDGAEVSAAAGEWTGWLPVKFEFNPVFQFRGIMRFHVRSVAPDFYAYASPVNFHPGEPPMLVPLSAPFDYSREVTERTGQLHETVGWAIATNPLKDELINEDEFLEDMWFSFDNRWRIIEKELERDDWRIFTGVLLATDRVQHMFMRYIDPEHPLYDPNAPDKYKNAIRETYKAMDRVVGETMKKYLDDQTDLWVISDHGFASFRKGVHVNSWLVENGFMTLKDPKLRQRGRLNTLFQGLPASNVDWSQTVAYSLGLGKIYLNRRGREPEGIVETPEEAEEIMQNIRKGLLDFRDPESGAKVVHEVYRREDLYQGPLVEESADMVLGFEKGYRVSWDTCLIEAPPGIIETNLNKWSGDHCSVDPSLVPGFLVSNRKITSDNPAIIDIARTALRAVGVTPPEAMEGTDLLR